jgi:hypothetical protein
LAECSRSCKRHPDDQENKVTPHCHQYM